MIIIKNKGGKVKRVKTRTKKEIDHGQGNIQVVYGEKVIESFKNKYDKKFRAIVQYFMNIDKHFFVEENTDEKTWIPWETKNWKQFGYDCPFTTF